MSNSPAQTNSSLSALQKYAESISSAVEIISSFCSSESLPHPSFDPLAPSVTIPSSAPLDVQNARQELIASTAAIKQLVTEPAEYLPHLAIHYQQLACLQWLCRFNVLSHVRRESPISYSDLASITGVPELQLKSVVRMAITNNFLCEPVPDQIAHNAVSALFAKDPGLTSWIKFMTKFSAPVAAAFGDATEKWGVTSRKDQTAFNIAMDTDVPFFDYFAKSPELSSTFASYMRSVQSSYGTSLNHLLAGFDWAGLAEAVVVDVGGSTASSSIALAEAFPRLRFVVEDLEGTISDRLLSALPKALSSRISTRTYDFFTAQPVQGADVYLLRMILHDWPAADAVKILKNQLKALRASPRARLIVMDTVLPRPGSISTVEEALLRVRDLTMIQTFNSKEREVGEFEELFSQARDEEGCLALKNIIKPPGSLMSVMEVIYRPDHQNGIPNGTEKS